MHPLASQRVTYDASRETTGGDEMNGYRSLRRNIQQRELAQIPGEKCMSADDEYCDANR